MVSVRRKRTGKEVAGGLYLNASMSEPRDCDGGREEGRGGYIHILIRSGIQAINIKVPYKAQSSTALWHSPSLSFFFSWSAPWGPWHAIASFKMQIRPGGVNHSGPNYSNYPPSSRPPWLSHPRLSPIFLTVFSKAYPLRYLDVKFEKSGI